MVRLLIAAPASGHGKTLVTCALLTAFQRRGLNPCAFKCGPDYIDPMFHRSVLGVESRNLDLFLSGETALRSLYAHGTAGHGAAVCEGAMGYYDGVGLTDRASAWRMARTLELPMVLVIRARGTALTLAASVRGLRDFRPESRIAGVILNECSPSLCRRLSPVLERETGIPVLGGLPRLKEAEIESRHLGLYAAPEIPDLRERLERLADALETGVDMERLLKLCEGDAPVTEPEIIPPPAVRIAVARDRAFCFLYAETLEAFRAWGGEPVFFSPLDDDELPENVGGLYLPGGYPELYADALSGNAPMREAVAHAVRGGLPTVAECGGFLYLGKALRDTAGNRFPMTGILPGEGFPAGRLVRFGYGIFTAQSDSLLFRTGERFPVHEFHHWDSTDNGYALHMEKADGGQCWNCGFTGETLYAGFPHLYFAGRPVLAQRFVTAAKNWIRRRRNGLTGSGRGGDAAG